MKKKYLSSAFLLLITSVVVKVIGAVYKIPLTAFIGAVGRGYFATAYNIYMPVFVVVMGAFPIALSRLISQYGAADNRQMIASLKKGAAAVFSLVGIAGTALIVMVAKPYAELVAGAPKSVYTVYVLAPSFLLSCFACCYRGFFEGNMNMTPTAVSQMLEALIKLLFGILFARYVLVLLTGEYATSGTVFGIRAADEEQAYSLIYPFTSAAAMLGVTFGTLISLGYLLVYDRRHREPVRLNVSGAAGRRELLRFSLPIFLSCAVQSVFQFLDTASVQFSLNRISSAVLKAHYAHSFAIPEQDLTTYVYGIFSTALDFKNIVPGITMALGVCAVPAICREYEQRNERELSHLMNAVFRYTSLLSSFGGAVIYVFAEEILTLFYRNSSDIVENSRSLVQYFGLSVPLYALASTAVFCVQAVGKPEKSVLPYVFSGVVRTVLNLLLIRNERFLLLGAVIAGAAGYALLFVLNLVITVRTARVRFHVFHNLLKPVIIGVLTVFLLENSAFLLAGVKNLYFNLLIRMLLLCLIYCILCIFWKVVDFKEIFSVLKTKKMA